MRCISVETSAIIQYIQRSLLKFPDDMSFPFNLTYAVVSHDYSCGFTNVFNDYTLHGRNIHTVMFRYGSTC